MCRSSPNRWRWNAALASTGPGRLTVLPHEAVLLNSVRRLLSVVPQTEHTISTWASGPAAQAASASPNGESLLMSPLTLNSTAPRLSLSYAEHDMYHYCADNHVIVWKCAPNSGWCLARRRNTSSAGRCSLSIVSDALNPLAHKEVSLLCSVVTVR